MPRADFDEQHLVVLDRWEESGRHVSHDVYVKIPRLVVEAAEKGNLGKQQKVIEAFVDAFKRKPRGTEVPENLIWDDFRHPILPTVQSRP